MKKIRWLLGLLLALNCWCAATADAAKVFADSERGFQIQMPNDWECLKNIDAFGFSRGKGNDTLLLAFYPPYPAARIGDYDMELLQQVRAAKYPKDQPLQQSEKIAGQETIGSTFSASAKNGTVFYGKRYLFWRNDGIVELICVTKTAQADAEMQAVIRSLRFTERTANEWRSKGEQDSKEKNYAAALDAFAHASQLDAKNADDAFWRAYLYKKQKQYPAALAELNHAIELVDGYSLYYGERGRIYDRMGKLEEALSDANKAIELTPNIYRYYVLRGNVLGEKGQYQNALKDFERAAELKGAIREEVLFNQAQTLELLGQREAALERYRLIKDPSVMEDASEQKVKARLQGDWETAKGWL